MFGLIKSFFALKNNFYLITIGNKSESKNGSKEEIIQLPLSVGFQNTGAIPKTKSVKDGKIYYILKNFIIYKLIY